MRERSANSGKSARGREVSKRNVCEVCAGEEHVL